MERMVKHRNPIMDIVLGMSPQRLLVDILHVFFVGLLKDFCTQLVWEIILRNTFALPDKPTADERISDCVDALAAELSTFYARWRRDHRDNPLTELQTFTKPMVGSSAHRCLRTKASETKGFFLFLCDVLRRHSHRLPRGDVWQYAAASLRNLMDILSSAPKVLAPGIVQDI